MDITILSVHRSGTHFLLYLGLVELGLNVQFDHFTSSFWRRLPDILALPAHTIVVLEPKPANLGARGEPQEVIDHMLDIYNQHLPGLLAAGALQFDIDDPSTADPILAALGIPRVGAVDAFLNEWPVIGPGHPSARLTALQNALTNSNRHWHGKPVLGDGI